MADSDETLIRRLIDRYLWATDAQDRERWRTCFADDVEFTILAEPDGTGGTLHSGIDAVMGAFRAVETFDSSQHVLSNAVVAVGADGDTAAADSFVVAFVLEGENMSVRGLRYRDALVRGDDGWRIRRRTHSLLWQFNARSSPPGLSELAQRHLSGH